MVRFASRQNEREKSPESFKAFLCFVSFGHKRNEGDLKASQSYELAVCVCVLMLIGACDS
ncbi:MAG TPA: hypothetical protein DCR48_02030 [Flavobacteriales bacterium]|nr:hypothetical protein [Flavobacteriales bacterium]